MSEIFQTIDEFAISDALFLALVWIACFGLVRLVRLLACRRDRRRRWEPARKKASRRGRAW